MELVKPRVIKNFLSKSEIEQIKTIVREIREDGLHSKILNMSWWGRLSHGIPVPINIKDKFDALAKEINDEYQAIRFNSFIYSGKYGKRTHLPPHQDDWIVQVTFDYQLDANVSWPLYVEGEKFTLENNDLLIFGGDSQVHWREEKFLTEDEYVDMFSISYSYPDYDERVKAGEFDWKKQDVDKRIRNAEKLYNPSFDIHACRSTDQVNHSMCSHD